MNLQKVRVTWIDDMTLICLEDLIDFYSKEYSDLLAVHTNGHGAEAQNSETAFVLSFLIALLENFTIPEEQHGEEELDSD